MKNEELHKLKPVYIHESSFSAENEISLIELTMVLIRHKLLIAYIFIIVVASGVAVAFLLPDKYDFTTSLEIGSQIIEGSIQPFESSNTFLAKLNHSFIPQTLHEYRLSHPEDNNNYKVTASVPNASQIILLKLQGTAESSDTIRMLLKNISAKGIQDHQLIYQSVKQNLVATIEQDSFKLASLNKKDTEQIDKIQDLNHNIKINRSILANLRNTREILPPMKSIDSKGISKKSITIISVITGIFLGVFAAFFTTFLSKVKQKIDNEKI